jgi:hypothetical protein
MSILRLYQYLETKRQSKHSTGRCSKHDSGERCHEEAYMHQDPSGMLARIPFGLTTGPIEGAEILVAGCRKETVASEMRSNVLKYRDTLFIYQRRWLSGKWGKSRDKQTEKLCHRATWKYQAIHPQTISSFSNGSETVNVEPLPCALCTVMSPPCRFTIS